MPLREPLGALFVFAFALTAFLLAGSLRNGAEIFPRTVAAVMIVGSAILFVRQIRRPVVTRAEGEEEPLPGETLRVVVAAGLTVGYVALIVPLGFVTSSLIYIPATAYLLGYRNHVVIWPTAVLFVGFVYTAFHIVFHIPLPKEAILRVLAG